MTIFTCEEFQLTWKRVRTTILANRSNVSILPVAHPRNTQHTVFNTREGNSGIVILTIVEELSYRRVAIAGEVSSIEVTNEILRSTTTKETAGIDIHNHHPFLLIWITINREFEEIGTFKLVRLCTITCTEGTYIGPVLQVWRRIEAHFFVGRNYHIPPLKWLIPEDLWVSEVLHTIKWLQNWILLILMERITAIGAISHTLRLCILLAIGCIKGDNRILTITCRTLLIYHRTTRENMPHRVAINRRLYLFPINKIMTYSMSPMHISPHRTVGVVLITEVVDPIFIKHTNRVVHPSIGRSMMIRRTIEVGIGHIPNV